MAAALEIELPLALAESGQTLEVFFERQLVGQLDVALVQGVAGVGHAALDAPPGLLQSIQLLDQPLLLLLQHGHLCVRYGPRYWLGKITR